MLKQLKEKYRHITKSYNNRVDNNNLSLYRIFVFVTSYKGQKRIWNFVWKVNRYVFRKLFGIKPDSITYYDLWMRQWFPTNQKQKVYRGEITTFRNFPKFSIILPVNNNSVESLKLTVDSILNQIYENWELCICSYDNHDPVLLETLEHYYKKDNRIKNCEKGEMSTDHDTFIFQNVLACTTGEFINFVNHGDLLSSDALFHIAKLLNETPDADLIYSDEDKFDDSGAHSDPSFKPDWCPDSFLSRNYIGNPVVIRKSLIQKTKFPQYRFKDVMLYNLLLHVTELTHHIHHIPLILYHGRVQSETRKTNSTNTNNSDIVSLEMALARRGINGKVHGTENLPGVYSIRYNIFKPEMVSIIIPSKNMAALCHVAVDSIFRLTDYRDFEVILIDNNSDEPDFFEFQKFWEQKEPFRFRCFREKGAFNFSRLMNYGASLAKGSYLLLLNNDTEVTHPDWLSALVEQAQFSTTGAVGVKLIYKNNTIQHAGVIIGLGGIAGHTFVGYDRNAKGYQNFLKCINNYSAVTAACLMVRKEVFLEVNGFDENLAVEFNDVDFCLKLIENGYRNVYLPHVELYHYESISRGHPHKTRKSYKQHLADVTLFKARWKKYIDHDPCYNPHLSRIFTDFRIGVLD